MVTVYHAGSEDIEFFPMGNATIETTAGRFRSAYSRLGLKCASSNPLGGVWQSRVPFSASSFWFTAVTYTESPGGTSGSMLMRFLDVNGVARLRFRCTAAGPPATMVCEKVNAAGTATQLGGAFSYIAAAATGKLDVHVVGGAAGQIDVYSNTGLIFSTGVVDTTTDGVSLMAYYQLSSLANSGVFGTIWSEMMVLDVDTRSLNLEGFDPVANGNTHNFDVGTPAAANVNETTVDFSTLDGSTTAGQIDQYTTGAVAASTLGVLAYGVSVLWQKGTAGPTKGAVGVRTGGADFWSADQSLVASFTNYSNWWTANPNTLVNWLPTEIGTTAGFNIGVRSAT